MRHDFQTTRTVAGALALGLALLGCSADTGSPAASTPEEEPAVEESSTQGSAAPDVEVELFDFGFGDLPSSVEAGTRFTVTNTAPAELHELVAFRLPDDEDRAVSELAELTPNELVAALGEPSAVLIAAPGGDQIAAVGDGTLADPGRYAVMCFIPTGADPEEYLEAAAEGGDGPPEVEGGPPHLVQGMFDELTVE